MTFCASAPADADGTAENSSPWPVHFRVPLCVYNRPLRAIAAQGGVHEYWHALTGATALQTSFTRCNYLNRRETDLALSLRGAAR